ncbi:hypothetical protein HD806DRAFT_19017 [Xylariaceae sp. AK1471]|nr:hypothetical protein HD806DRAFT_19017 [Xylariaceae sp. AK1471]
MDPFNALSIAASIVQFVNFTLDVLRDCREIRQAGQPLTFEAFEQTTNDLIKLTSILKSQARLSKNPTSPLAEHEKALDSLVVECSSIAQELANALKSLKPKKIDHAEAEARAQAGKNVKHHGPIWTSFLQALKTIWKADYIDGLKSRLNIYREELVMRILACLNAKMDMQSSQQSDRFDTLDQNQARIVGALVFNQGELKELRNDLESEMSTIKRHHGEVIAAILTLSNGQTTSLIPPGPTNNVDNSYEQSILHLSSMPVSEHALQATLETFGFSGLTRRVLENLHFLQITERMENVKDAHRETFGWVFRRPRGTEGAWADFPRWLKSGDGCYWVNGKAGSGKSTLMKMIWDEPGIASHLTSWADHGTLATASFFFWNIGSRLQKSQQGLLRSLLYDILEVNPRLIPSVMPEICKEAAKSYAGVMMEDPTMIQLRRWFNRLVQQCGPDFRMFFLIDGLDEYDGDHFELIDLITSTAGMYVKFLVSSRPITACTDAFKSGPTLRLQDLTRNDMRTYCCDLLGKRLSNRGGSEFYIIIDEIVERSSGVFLWLVLVVKSIIRGLVDGDLLDELKARLEEIPTELADLYTHMMNRIPLRYRSQSSEIFQVYLKSRLVEQDIRGHPLLAIQLSFAQENWDTVCQITPDGMSKQDELKKCEEFESRLQSRCCGLLEFYERKVDRRPKPLIHRLVKEEAMRPHVEFIHRSAAEFLQDESVWNMVKSWGQSNPLHRLFHSCVMIAKNTRPSEVVYPQGSVVWDTMYTALRYARIAETENDPLPREYFVEFDRVIAQHWKYAEWYVRIYAATDAVHLGIEKRETRPKGHWSRVIFWSRTNRTNVWDEQIGQNDNSFRGLPSSFNEDALVDASDILGFSRVAIVYSLGSYLKTQITTSLDPEGTSGLLQIWMSLLTSSFPLRIRMPADTRFSQHILEAGMMARDKLGEEDILLIWNIFLTELLSSKDVSRLDPHYCQGVKESVMRFYQAPEGQAECQTTTFWSLAASPSVLNHALQPRLGPLKLVNGEMHQCLLEISYWLGNQVALEPNSSLQIQDLFLGGSLARLHLVQGNHPPSRNNNKGALADVESKKEKGRVLEMLGYIRSGEKSLRASIVRSQAKYKAAIHQA